MVHCGLNAARSGNYQHSSGSQGAETTLTWIQRFGLTGVVLVIVPGDSVTARQSDIHPCCSVRWWGYQRSNGIPDFSCDALKVLWVFTWTLSRFTGYVSRRSIRVRINQWKATSRVTRPRKVARVSQSRSKYDDTYHIFHAPWSYWNILVSRNLCIACDPSLTSFSQSQAESVSNISSQLGETLFRKQYLQNTMTPRKILSRSVARTIEPFYLLLHIVWYPHISDSSWLEYLWQLVIHSDQWEAELISDWPIRSQHGELLQQRASSHHRV